MNLNGLYINTNGNSLDKASLGEQELKLLAAGDGVEVMIQEITSGIPFVIAPSEQNSNLMEFFYILEGELEFLPVGGNPSVLKTGDFLYTKKLENSCLFKTITKVKLLYISSQPVFHFLGESLNELKKFTREVEEKDNYTHGHSERVRDYALKIALELGLDRETVIKIALAALFHDVGKIYIPDDVLKKPGKLTKQEYEIIQQHVGYSTELVKKIKYIDISYIVEQHHEKIDGSGYPKGLKEDEICLEAKIVAVADAYDTMTTERPYRKSMSVKETVQELLNYSGKHFDKNIASTFVNILKKENIYHE